MSEAEPERIVNDAPENRCFGCSPHNERGLRMTFLRLADGSVEAPCTLEEHFCGAPGVVHGGIQAALLDEAMGMACHAALEGEEHWLVTAEFSLRYRRPAPVGQPLVVRGEMVRRDGRDFYVTGAIVDASGERVTVAQARWRQLERPRGA